MQPDEITVKSILSKLKDAPDPWFGITYNMNLYRGCMHGCIYCDSRSECYRLGDLGHIRVKKNAIELLQTELKNKKTKGTIGTGSMNDPYMPVENQTGITRRALEIINYYKFPVHIITKSNLVTRDIDILKQISKIYAAVSITITTTNDNLSRIIEPNAPVSSQRFKAIEQLAANGIYCGVTLMPVLPFITDNVENINQIVQQAANCGANYVIASMGVTLRDKQRDYYFDKLEKHFPGTKNNYIARYKNGYLAKALNYKVLEHEFLNSCHNNNISTAMQFYNNNTPGQLSLF